MSESEKPLCQVNVDKSEYLLFRKLNAGLLKILQLQNSYIISIVNHLLFDQNFDFSNLNTYEQS